MKVIHEMVWPGDVGPEGGLFAKLAKQKGKHIGLGTRVQGAGEGDKPHSTSCRQSVSWVNARAR